MSDASSQGSSLDVRESEERLRLATEAAELGIWEFDPISGRLTWPDVARRIWQIEPGREVTWQVWKTAIHPDDRDAVEARVLASLNPDGTGEQDMEYRVLRADGEIRWVRVRGRAHFQIVDGQRKAVRVLGTVQDVTVAKYAEEALRRSEARARALIDSVVQLMWTNDPQGRTLYYNSRWSEYTGMEMFEADWLSLVHPEDRARLLEVRAGGIPSGQAYEVEYRLRRFDGEYRWHLVRVVPVKDELGRVLNWFGTATDVHDMKMAEQRLAEAKREAEAANSAKDRFLAVLSHELRTPLTPVVMSVSALAMDPNLPAEARQELAMVRRNVELETKLIDDLLDITRIVNGKLRLNVRAQRAHELLNNVMEICGSEAMAKRLKTDVDLKAEDDRIAADGARMQQVFWNLIKNAIKFTPEEGRVQVRTHNPRPGQFVLEVADSGVGIDPAAMGRLFNAFEQGEQKVTRQFGGLGLGLAISKALVDLHGGTILVHSDGKGCGATFTLGLPTTGVVERMVDSIEEASAVGDQPLPKPIHVLLVDDHADTLRLLGRLLEARGLRVTTVANAAAALAAASQIRFDILVSD
ncbi:MAG TPA: PAS domain-containing protein, partial [Tepidisphaeraceae bacterium]|nr:PAS domain-containing protein [Tepidisphaeraceae bacterium]